jgi:hypothetical protein
MATKIFERCIVLNDVAAGLLLKSNMLRKAPPPCLGNMEWTKVSLSAAHCASRDF